MTEVLEDRAIGESEPESTLTSRRYVGKKQRKDFSTSERGGEKGEDWSFVSHSIEKEAKGGLF